MPVDTPPRRQFNVMLTPSEYQQLALAAQSMDVTKATYLRRALTHRLKMDLHGLPTCASGQACCVPHMHGPGVVQRELRPPTVPQPAELPPYATFDPLRAADHDLPPLADFEQETDQ